jgi:hypothetical protein
MLFLSLRRNAQRWQFQPTLQVCTDEPHEGLRRLPSRFSGPTSGFQRWSNVENISAPSLWSEAHYCDCRRFSGVMKINPTACVKAGSRRMHLYCSAAARFGPDQNLYFALERIGKLWNGDSTTHQVTMQP